MLLGGGRQSKSRLQLRRSSWRKRMEQSPTLGWHLQRAVARCILWPHAACRQQTCIERAAASASNCGSRHFLRAALLRLHASDFN
ncbi:hypothetical protein PC119_g5961 [Phytophthora cactorum]|nr:hypothetical protein PC119_g5961 [Phytophthora cactorum]